MNEARVHQVRNSNGTGGGERWIDNVCIDWGNRHARHTRLDNSLSSGGPRQSKRLNETLLMAQDRVAQTNCNRLSGGDVAGLNGPRYIVRRFV